MESDLRAIVITVMIFVFKFIFVMTFYGILNYKKRRNANFITAWMLSYLYEILLMLMLSFYNSLYSMQLAVLSIISLGCLGGLFICIRKKCSAPASQLIFEFEDVIPITIMFGFCVFCMIRAFVYCDSTPDANAYGMPRIYLLSTSGSLYVHMKNLAKNIFVNEWNGELNAVFYRVISGNNISISFANIEIYFYAILSFWACGREIFKEKRYSIYLAYCVMFLPVVVFLAFTCKGDLLAMLSFPLFVILCFFYWKDGRRNEEDNRLLLGVVVTGAISSGARITLIPAIGLIMIIFLSDLLIHKRIQSCRKCLLWSFVAYAIGWARYILNILYYGNPFERVDVSNETLAPNVNRFLMTSAKYIEDILHGENIFTHEGVMYALSADAGIMGGIILISACAAIVYIIYRLIYKKELIKKYWKELSVIMIVMSVQLFMLCSLDYYPWSFRYFAPFFLCITVGVIYLLNYIRNNKIVSICWGMILAFGTISAYSTINMATLEGEVTGDSWNNMLKKEEINKRYAFHEWLIEHPEGESDISDFYDDIRTNKKVLVCTNIDQIISWCWGDNASNKVTLCEPQEFQEYYEQEEWDAVVVGETVEVNKDIISLYQYKKYVPTGLQLEVYIKGTIYQQEFRAENFAEQEIAYGVLPFDGCYCWLSEEAAIPIEMDARNGVRIVFAAGNDLILKEEVASPKVDIYVDELFVCSTNIVYTGEYEIEVLPDFFESDRSWHVFRFCTNASIDSENSYCIRLKEIVPIQ